MKRRKDDGIEGGVDRQALEIQCSGTGVDCYLCGTRDGYHVAGIKKMIDAHVHIERGPYTEEWIAQFIDIAVQRGISKLYLLEHSHRFHEFRGLYSQFIQYSRYQSDWINKHMKSSVFDYQRLVSKCRNQHYAIDVKFGLEVCYEDNCEDLIKSVTGQFDWDFLTGAIHWVYGWGFDHKREEWNGRDIDRTYREYYEKMIRLVRSGLFDHLAHPDSIKCFGYNPPTDLSSYYLRLARTAASQKVKAEFSCGLNNNYGHPEIGLNREMLEIFQQAGVELITASDAHRPEDVGKGIAEANERIHKRPAERRRPA